jgi:hypothetical protein
MAEIKMKVAPSLHEQLSRALDGKAYYVRPLGSQPAIIAMIGRETPGMVERILASALTGLKYDADRSKSAVDYSQEIRAAVEVPVYDFLEAFDALRGAVHGVFYRMSEHKPELAPTVYPKPEPEEEK